MFCENCGKQLPDTAAFCTGCGTKTNVTPVSEFPSSVAQPTVAAATSSIANQSVSAFQAPVPPAARPVLIPPQHSHHVQPEPMAAVTPMQPKQPYGAAPGGARPAQPYGAAPGGARPGVQQSVFEGSNLMSYGQYLVMLLLTCIPIVNIVLLFKWSFFGIVNPNKRNFAKAMLTIVIIAFLFSMIMGIATASMFR